MYCDVFKLTSYSLLQETIPHPVGVGFLIFQFNAPLYVGATNELKDGYVGCMSSLQVNGETLDLYDKVANEPEKFSYGMTLGKCPMHYMPLSGHLWATRCN